MVDKLYTLEEVEASLEQQLEKSAIDVVVWKEEGLVLLASDFAYVHGIAITARQQAKIGMTEAYEWAYDSIVGRAGYIRKGELVYKANDNSLGTRGFVVAPCKEKDA